MIGHGTRDELGIEGLINNCDGKFGVVLVFSFFVFCAGQVPKIALLPG